MRRKRHKHQCQGELTPTARPTARRLQLHHKIPTSNPPHPLPGPPRLQPNLPEGLAEKYGG